MRILGVDVEEARPIVSAHWKGNLVMLDGDVTNHGCDLPVRNPYSSWIVGPAWQISKYQFLIRTWKVQFSQKETNLLCLNLGFISANKCHHHSNYYKEDHLQVQRFRPLSSRWEVGLCTGRPSAGEGAEGSSSGPAAGRDSDMGTGLSFWNLKTHPPVAHFLQGGHTYAWKTKRESCYSPWAYGDHFHSSHLSLNPDFPGHSHFNIERENQSTYIAGSLWIRTKRKDIDWRTSRMMRGLLQLPQIVTNLVA